MQQAHTQPATQPLQPKAPVAPASQTAPLPLDPNLLRHVGHVVSREMLARDVWRVTARATPLDNVIDVTVTRLRRKIDDPFGRKLLHTVRGVGFVLRREGP